MQGNEFHRLTLHYRTFSVIIVCHHMLGIALCYYGGKISPIPYIFPLSTYFFLVELFSFSVFHALPAALGWFSPFTKSAHMCEIGCKPYALAQ